MDMMRFCMALAGCAVGLVIFVAIAEKCAFRPRVRDLSLGAIALTVFPVLGYANMNLLYQVFSLNDDLTEAELNEPRESTFLHIIYLVMAFIIFAGAFIACAANCCYLCCIVAWLDAFKRYRSNRNNLEN